MKCLILIALVAVASAKPSDMLVQKVAVPKDGVISELKMIPVGHSAPVSYPVAYSMHHPMQYVQPAMAKPVEVKTFLKPVGVQTYAAVKPVEMIKPVVKPVAYAKPFEAKFVAPMTYSAPVVAAPVIQKKFTYAYQPVETQFVAKPYEIPVKKVEFVAEKSACKNSFGAPVPCRQIAKREANHHVKMADSMVYEQKPLTYATHMPVATHMPIATHMPVATPYYYNTNMPAAVATEVEYKALPKKVQKIEVPQPYYKEYVEKVALKPGCMNNYGMAVPCNDYM